MPGMVSLPIQSYATGSDWGLDDVELINDLEAGFLVTGDSGYTQQYGDIASLLLMVIFFMGMAAGLLFGSIMWREVR